MSGILNAAVRLVRPAREHLAGYTAALSRGWSPDTTRAAAAQEELAAIAADADAFLARLHDPQALGPPVTLADGSKVDRLPGFRCWILDDTPGDEAFAGSINLRWPKGGGPLPPHVLGHIGYAVVPWKQRRGVATAALGLLLPLAREQGLKHVLITTDPANVASQRVITANGGVLLESFNKGSVYGFTQGLRYRIELS